MRKAVVIFFVLVYRLVCAQHYPVHINNHLTPPYSGYLADYADPGSEKMKLILQLNDFSVPQVSVRLKFEIKGDGFTLSTKAFYNPAPITLQPGQPFLITGADLGPYLSPANLDFTGISLSQYQQLNHLPEGYYSICVTAYDYYNANPIQLSNEACTMAWFTLSDPPFLNSPACGNVMQPLYPQNIVFQWVAMNLGSPNSGMNTEYEFALWECRPDSNANPNQVVLSTAPIFSTVTQQSFFNYGITEPALNLYMKYVWRVRAKDVSGRDLFKNQGYSQVCTFRYGSPQNVINGLQLELNAQALTHRMGRCDWNKQSIYTTYLLQVRKSGTTEWFDYNNTSGIEKIMNLEPFTQYETRVRGEGNGITGDWSNNAVFTTLQAPDYACNNQTMPGNNGILKPLPVEKAVKGLIIQSGQFEVHVTQIYCGASPGWYGGKGYVTMMGIKRVPVKWSHIYIDDTGKQQQGVIEAETKGIDNWTHQWDITEAENNATYVNGAIDSVYISGNQMCYTLPGNTIPICVSTPTGANVMVIRDADGNEYVVDLSPPPPRVSGPTNYFEFSDDSLDATDSKIVNFLAAPTQSFGFDKKEYAAFYKNYEIIKLKNGKNYFVPNKSIGLTQTDNVWAQVQVDTFNPALLKFKTKAGADLQFSSAAQQGKFVISGIGDNVGSIYAIYNNKKIGKLNITPLKVIAKKVVVVPVNGVSAPANISASLNGIFKQANVTWTVTTAPNFSFNLGSDGLEAADAGLFSKYSPEMRALRDAYKQHDSLYDKNAYYLFVVSGFSNPDLKGYMVRGRAVGFIVQNASGKETAHELAHGGFALEHTFPAIQKATTDNLMDYGAGTQMVKEQWTYCQMVNTGFNWKDDEEDGALSNTPAGVFYWINKIRIANKNSTQIQIPEKMDVIGWTTDCYLTGVHFDFIWVAVKYQYNGYNADVRSKIVLSVIPRTTNNGIVMDSCIRIDVDKIIIRTQNGRHGLLKKYLEGTNTFKNLMLFVNGYRPIVNGDGDPVNSAAEYENSNNQVEFGDSRNYWKGIDAAFMNRIGTRQAVYADGHHSVGTSNHMSTLKYIEGQLLSDGIRMSCMTNPLQGICSSYLNGYLHTIANEAGFVFRAKNGMEAGKDLVQKINSGQIVFDKVHDTLDIVAHSMGYAYAVGMIAELDKANIVFGRFYILAPENACSGGYTWTKFNEVWQYGSNLGQTDADPPWFQDGVAPQCECSDLVNSNDKINTRSGKHIRTGRAYIPKTWPIKGYLQSHSVSNYTWIFSSRLPGMDGYVKPR